MDRVTQYATDVVEGRIVAGRWVRLASQRHLDDIRTGDDRGLYYDPDRAAHVLTFCESFLCLAGGEHEGQPFVLQPWQAFLLGSLFGWLGADGYRRFRTAYIEIGKGNGKSPLAAAIGLYCLMADYEPRAEVYAAATKKDQAMILFRDAIAMVDQSPALSRVLTKSGARGREWNIAHLSSGSFFRPISSDDGQSGPRPHCGLIDEVHEHRTSHVIDMVRAGTKGRRQALIVEITNSGHDRQSVCWHHHQYSLDVLRGTTPNDAWFAFVCGLDPCPEHQAEGKTQPVDGCPSCDDWRDPKVWPKANPNLGVSVTEKYLTEQIREAEGMPSKQGVVRRLNLCHWTEGETSWLPPDLWSQGSGPVDWDALRGAACFGGLDLASKTDIAAFALLFPDTPEPGHYTLKLRFWIPHATAEARSVADGIPYLLWAEQGWITLTEGDVIDQDAIESAIKQDAEDYRIEDVAFDPWNASMIAVHLQQHGVPLVEFRQNLRNFNEPSKQFEALLKDGKLHHGDNPVLDWMAGSVTVITDASGNIRPVKPTHGNARKIDGIVASIMALGRAIVTPELSGGGVEVW